MDDANLAKLVLDQPGMTPQFDKNVVNYNIVVAFNVEKLKLSLSCSDNGASFSVKSDTGYGEDVKLNEGENKIIIEVTSEDGTVKKYFISCKRLSASDAKIKHLEFNIIKLPENFNSTNYEYKCFVKPTINDDSFKIELFDPGCQIECTCNNSNLTKTDQSFYNFSLNYGYSELVIKVISPNKTNTQNYVVKFTKNPVCRIGSFLNLKDCLEYEDPISMAPIYCAFRITESVNIHSYPFIDLFQKIASQDQLNVISLSSEHVDPQLNPQINLENKLSDIKVKVPYLNGDFSQEMKLKNISLKLEEINNSDVVKISEDDLKSEVVTKINKMPESLPTYQPRTWEKHLQIIYDEKDGEKLLKQTDSHIERYISTLNSNTIPLKLLKKNENDSPLYFLNMSIFTLATALKYKNRDFQLHFKLAKLLEEKLFFENIYGSEQEKDEENDKHGNLNNQNKMAADSSKEEEIDALCLSRGVKNTASDVEKLKAIDQEYHFLIESKQNAKAEHVQQLYHFKAQKINSGGKSNLKSNENRDYLLQANFKYIDGLSLILESKVNNFLAYFLVGRSFCKVGDHSQALIYLKNCIIWPSDLKMQSLSRFYFGFALSHRIEIVLSNPKLITSSICSGLQSYMESISTSFSNRNILFSDDMFSIFNTDFLEGFLIVGKIQLEHPNTKFDCIKPEDAFKYCGWLVSITLSLINSRAIFDKELLKTSKLIQELIRILIEAHNGLANLNFKMEPDQLNDLRTLKSKRCTNLINLIRSLTERDNEYILRLQEKACESLVFADPLSSYNLLLLASSKLELYDYLLENKKETDSNYLNQLLEESKYSIIASSEFDDAKSQDEVPNLISDQFWWKEAIKAAEKLAETEKPKSANKDKEKTTTTSQAPPKPNTSKAPIKTVTPAPASKNTTKAPPQPVKTKAPTANNAKSPAAPPVNPTPAPSETNPVEPLSNNEASTSKANPKYIKKKNFNFNKFILFVQINIISARVYSRLKEFDKARSFYEKAIQKEPKKQDAYIELATMLKKNGDMKGAIDVYSSFPIKEKSEETKDSKNEQSSFFVFGWKPDIVRRFKNGSTRNLTFDDAFIYGELVTLLFNNQFYDDPRLTKYLILWAEVMGIGIVEKYITILDKANKTKACKEVYASVHKKKVDDPDLAQFFKFKGWV